MIVLKERGVIKQHQDSGNKKTGKHVSVFLNLTHFKILTSKCCMHPYNIFKLLQYTQQFLYYRSKTLYDVKSKKITVKTRNKIGRSI